jgi:hypothetical protein
MQTIRRLGLNLILALLRAFTRPASAGWKRSTRPPTLLGR